MKNKTQSSQHTPQIHTWNSVREQLFLAVTSWSAVCSSAGSSGAGNSTAVCRPQQSYTKSRYTFLWHLCTRMLNIRKTGHCKT